MIIAVSVLTTSCVARNPDSHRERCGSILSARDNRQLIIVQKIAVLISPLNNDRPIIKMRQKNKKGLYLLILAMTILTTQFSCNSISKSTNNSVREDKTEDFKTFLNKFKTDSTFQYSRVSFPLTQESSGDLDESENSIIQIDSHDWHYLDLKYYPSFATRDIDSYTEKIDVSMSSARLLYQGVDNGINVEYIFELRDKVWYLKRWNDYSN